MARVLTISLSEGGYEMLREMKDNNPDAPLSKVIEHAVRMYFSIYLTEKAKRVAIPETIEQMQNSIEMK